MPSRMTHPSITSNRPRWRSLGILALLLALLLWPLHELAERYYSARLAEQNRQTLDLYVANLLGTLRSYETLPGILGNLPVLRNALLSPSNSASLELANHQLMRLKHQTGADVIYLMRADGLTIASSNWDQPDSFVGRNFAFRPYFLEAMDGRLGRFFGLGNTSGKRGYYFGQAIEHGRERVGVLVVKLDLDRTETLWGNSPERLLVTDSRAWRFSPPTPAGAFAPRGRCVPRSKRPSPCIGPTRPSTCSSSSWTRCSGCSRAASWTRSAGR